LLGEIDSCFIAVQFIGGKSIYNNKLHPSTPDFIAVQFIGASFFPSASSPMQQPLHNDDSIVVPSPSIAVNVNVFVSPRSTPK